MFTKSSKISLHKKITLSVLGMLCVYLLFMAYFWQQGEVSFFDKEPITMLDKGWIYEDTLGNKQEISIPARLKIEPEERVLLHYMFSKEKTDLPIWLCFRSSQQRVRVFYNEKEIYNFGASESQSRNSKPPFGKTYGSAWNIIQIPSIDESNEEDKITIELTSPYRNYGNVINPVLAGGKSGILSYIFETYMPVLVITLLIFLIGLFLGTIHLFILRKSIENKSILYLGYFAMIISVWMFGESKLVQFFTKEVLFSMTCTILSLLIFPIPMVKYICAIENFSYKRQLKKLIPLLYANTIIVCFLQAMSIYDFIEMMPTIHIIILAAMVIVLIAVFMDCFVNNNVYMCSVAYSFAILFVLGLWELVGFYRQWYFVTGNFIRAGVLIFIIVQTKIVVDRAMKIIRLSKTASHYEKLATVDELTGCLNRTAYREKLQTLIRKELVCAVVVDLNNLKTINDTLGHEIGDDALVRCSKCFLKAFDRFGGCYRMGGDEFLFLSNNAGENHLKENKLTLLIKEFEGECEKEGKETHYEFRVAVGYAIFDRSKDTSLEDTIKRADCAMYENKKKMKSLRHTG